MVSFLLQIANNRRMTVKYNPPSSCVLEINVKGIKLSVQEDFYASDRVRRPSFIDWSGLCWQSFGAAPMWRLRVTAFRDDSFQNLVITPFGIRINLIFTM